MIALSDVLDLDVTRDFDAVRDFLRARGLNKTLAGRIPRSLAKAGCSTLREAEERLARGDRLKALRHSGPFPQYGLGAASERELRSIFGLPPMPPSRRIVLTLIDGAYVDQDDVEWIRAEELDEVAS